ncbi:MAG: hypothetical protein AUI10_12765 [Actinobacteria bacterium 13_2_20CM_2_72_6]|nr:MAG: hypothetical protein AUI10_12765 [Actinobacteria bacterium 13_2_20CM_2_72_6]
MEESPAVARRRVRLALRTAREAKGLTQTQIAEAMEWSLSKVMRIENGDVNVSVSDLRALLAYLDLTDAVVTRHLLADAKIARRARYSLDRQYKEHLPPGLFELMQFEQEAAASRYFNAGLVPGLLQTPHYAAAIFEIYTAGLSDATIKVRHEARLERQRRLLAQPNPSELFVILDESVLHRRVGGPDVMVDQLRFLLSLTGNERVSIRIIPFSAPAPIGNLGPFCILDMEGERDAILYRERPDSDEIVRKQQEVIRHRSLMARLWSFACGPADSARLIQDRVDLISAAPSLAGEPH